MQNFLSQPLLGREHIAYAHVDEHAYDVVGNGDKGACGNGRVYLEPLEGEGHESTEYRGEYHDGK